MGNSSSNRGGMAITLTLMAALTGGYFFLNSELESSRPSQGADFSRYGSSSEFVRTRLWQDPLLVIQNHWQALLAFVEVRQSLPAAVALPPTISSLYEQLAINNDENSQTLRLFVLMNGGPYAEDIEQRRRQRYALVSALTEEDFVPDDEANIGYFIMPQFRDALFQKTPTLPVSCGPIGSFRCPVHEPPILIGYETYSYTNEFNDEVAEREGTAYIFEEGDIVQVFWLNSNDFRQMPMDQLAALIHSLDLSLRKNKDIVNLPQFNGHSKKVYHDREGVFDEQECIRPTRKKFYWGNRQLFLYWVETPSRLHQLWNIT